MSIPAATNEYFLAIQKLAIVLCAESEVGHRSTIQKLAIVPAADTCAKQRSKSR